MDKASKEAGVIETMTPNQSDHEVVLGQLVRLKVYQLQAGITEASPFPCMQRGCVEPRTFWLSVVTLNTAPGLSFK